MEINLFYAVIQSGSFGLLAYLIIYGIPNWIKSLREERREERESLEKRHDVLVNTFREATTNERETCERRHKELSIGIDRVDHRIRNVQQHLVLGKAIEDGGTT